MPYRLEDLNPPRGMRDFPPEMEILRRKVFDRIDRIFRRYGFDPLETPIVERWEILSGKYGEEAENKLMWRFKLPYSDREFGLRFDLTVPLARYIARYRPRLPFKRYHIGRVYRYEEPQKGRYREFWQCDVDIVGVDSPLADAEIINVVSDIMGEFGLEYRIKINDRLLLRGLFERHLGLKDNDLILRIYRTIDKLDKIGRDKVLDELEGMGLPGEVIGEISRIIDITGYSDVEILDSLSKYGEEEVSKSVSRISEILDLVKYRDRVEIDLSLVRGLDYYTGMIYEAVVTKPRIGSLSGGGRYDDLIGLFTGERVPAVGGSIGVERLIDAGIELGILDMGEKTYVDAGIIYLRDTDLREVIRIVDRLRGDGLNIYLPYQPYKTILHGIRDLVSRGIKHAIVIGRRELEGKTLTIQDLEERTRIEAGVGEAYKIIKGRSAKHG